MPAYHDDIIAKSQRNKSRLTQMLLNDDIDFEELRVSTESSIERADQYITGSYVNALIKQGVMDSLVVFYQTLYPKSFPEKVSNAAKVLMDEHTARDSSVAQRVSEGPLPWLEVTESREGVEDLLHIVKAYLMVKLKTTSGRFGKLVLVTTFDRWGQMVVSGIIDICQRTGNGALKRILTGQRSDLSDGLYALLPRWIDSTSIQMKLPRTGGKPLFWGREEIMLMMQANWDMARVSDIAERAQDDLILKELFTTGDRPGSIGLPKGATADTGLRVSHIRVEQQKRFEYTFFLDAQHHKGNSDPTTLRYCQERQFPPFKNVQNLQFEFATTAVPFLVDRRALCYTAADGTTVVFETMEEFFACETFAMRGYGDEFLFRSRNAQNNGFLDTPITSHQVGNHVTLMGERAGLPGAKAYNIRHGAGDKIQIALGSEAANRALHHGTHGKGRDVAFASYSEGLKNVPIARLLVGELEAEDIGIRQKLETSRFYARRLGSRAVQRAVRGLGRGASVNIDYSSLRDDYDKALDKDNKYQTLLAAVETALNGDVPAQEDVDSWSVYNANLKILRVEATARRVEVLAKIRNAHKSEVHAGWTKAGQGATITDLALGRDLLVHEDSLESLGVTNTSVRAANRLRMADIIPSNSSVPSIPPPLALSNPAQSTGEEKATQVPPEDPDFFSEEGETSDDAFAALEGLPKDVGLARIAIMFCLYDRLQGKKIWNYDVMEMARTGECVFCDIDKVGLRQAGSGTPRSSGQFDDGAVRSWELRIKVHCREHHPEIFPYYDAGQFPPRALTWDAEQQGDVLAGAVKSFESMVESGGHDSDEAFVAAFSPTLSSDFVSGLADFLSALSLTPSPDPISTPTTGSRSRWLKQNRKLTVSLMNLAQLQAACRDKGIAPGSLGKAGLQDLLGMKRRPRKPRKMGIV
ncbi:hypothetical protein P7C70_g4432, partial [Phenoliferia sp. Uapishka_3]